jgi:hypothetical protein
LRSVGREAPARGMTVESQSGAPDRAQRPRGRYGPASLALRRKRSRGGAAASLRRCVLLACWGQRPRRPRRLRPPHKLRAVHHE